MKISFISLFFAALFAVAGIAGMSFTPANLANNTPANANTGGVPETYKVDLSSSNVGWKAYKVTGEHFGTVNLKSGALTFENGVLTGGSFEMDMASIKVTDSQGEWATKLEGHLKSDDFFSVEKNPTAKFVVTKVASRGTPGNYRVTGNLTIKGITKEVKFDATIKADAGKASGEAALKIDRTDFNIQYRSGNFFENLGDKTIYDEFDLTVKLVATK